MSSDTSRAQPSAVLPSAMLLNLFGKVLGLGLKWLSPPVEGKLPHGMGAARLFDLPAEWSRQRQVLGLAAQ